MTKHHSLPLILQTASGSLSSSPYLGPCLQTESDYSHPHLDLALGSPQDMMEEDTTGHGAVPVAQCFTNFFPGDPPLKNDKPS